MAAASESPRKRRRTAQVVDLSRARSARGEESSGPRKPKVVVTGGAGLLGSRLVKALAARGDREVVVFDLAPALDVDVKYRFLNLNLPYSDGATLKLLKEERPDVIVHLAQLRSPSRDTTYAHELNSLGVLHVLAAAGEAGVKRVIVGSTTMVYGARGDNPNYLTESHPLRPDPRDHFVRDFVEAEDFARAHVKRSPDTKLAILRFVPLLAPDLRDYRSKLFASPAAITLFGYDPLIQALDPEDAISALTKALDNPEAHGVFNIAPDGVLPLSTVFLLHGTLAVPVIHPLAYPMIEAAWLAGVGLMPGVHAHYLRYLCVADNAKAKRVLGWEPKSTTFETVLRTARERRGRGRLLDFDEIEKAAKANAWRLGRMLAKDRGRSAPAVERGERAAS